MSRIIQHRRGNSAQHQNFVGAPGEITYDTDLNTLRVHDGKTPGGVVLARKQDIVKSSLSDTVVTLNLAPDTRWTAPGDGYIFIYGTSSGTNQGIWLALRTSNDSAAIGYDDSFSSAANQKLTVSLPMSAGQKIFYSVSNGINNIVITFVKTKGDS